MKVLLWLMMMLPWARGADLTCNCGWRNIRRIYGGKEAKKNEYPWMAALNIGCGGSIITPNHVLTAAHCTDRRSPKDLQVLVGIHYRISGSNPFGKLHDVSKIFQHERYNRQAITNDISILFLSKPVSYNHKVGPVCLPHTQRDLEGKFIKVTGWGLTKNTGDQNVLREVDIQVISRKECQRQWSIVTIRQTQICAFTRFKDSCNANSGGPLVYEDPDTHRFTQVALVSFGPKQCGTDPRPSVNTNVFSYVDWIKNVVTRSSPENKVCSKA
ncbi:venom serine protease [Halyomorpha halys]|uniref:venom serine protease n=1 Tax=Halyomorpha halys TaxID=286706 RepID=UPI0034D1A72F